jgi:Rrf2 family protein
MQLSTKARYATRAMLELAINYGEGTLQLKEIARRQDISEKYLEQVLFPLRAKGYIYTQKGSRGGYSLSMGPEEITLYDIVQTVEGSLAPVACVDNAGVCDRVDICVTRDVWSRLKNIVIQELKSINLADLVVEQERKIKEAGSCITYQI